MSYNRAEYDTDALRHNYRVIKSLVGDKKVLAAVKANGYGMGALPMVQVLLEEGVDYFGVAILEEALELRGKGITAPILVFGAIPQKELAKAVYNDITVTVYSFTYACILDYLGKELGKKAKIHIKLDTGMHRLGFPLTENTLGEIKVIGEMPHVEMEGIFSHLAQSDCSKEYTEMQITRFQDFTDALMAHGVSIPIRHLANSVGILDYPHAHFDMVRGGILFHGFGSDSENSKKLKEVLSLKSAIVRIHEAEDSAEISYTGSHITKGTRRIATIPLGYADGYFRCLSNKAEALLKGKRIPQVGNICMDQMMFDITDVEDVKLGDEVVLWGEQNGAFLSLKEIADLAGTITYEMLTSQKRVPKYYYFEDDD